MFISPLSVYLYGYIIDWYFFVDVVRLRILHTDYQNALIATCSHLHSDEDVCPPEHFSVFIYTLDGAPSDVTLRDIRTVARGACQNIGELMVIGTSTKCPLRQMNCVPNKVPHQDNFSMARVCVELKFSERIFGERMGEGIEGGGGGRGGFFPDLYIFCFGCLVNIVNLKFGLDLIQIIVHRWYNL